MFPCKPILWDLVLVSRDHFNDYANSTKLNEFNLKEHKLND